MLFIRRTGIALARFILSQCNPSRSDDADFFGLDEEFAIQTDAIESFKILSPNTKYLALSVNVIAVITLHITAEDMRQSWLLRAWGRDEASKFALLLSELPEVVNKLFNRTLWHQTARMRLIQFRFHKYGVDEVANAIKAKQNNLNR